MVTRLRQLLHDQRGVALTEALLTFPLVLLALATLIEFGALVHRAGMQAKALEIGARLAAVSLPVLTDWSALTADFPVAEGGPLPLATVTLRCGRGSAPCDATRLTRLLRGSDGQCNAAAGTSLRGMCDLVANFPVASLRVSYTRTGQGVVLHDRLPQTIVTLDLPAVAVELPLLSGLLGRNLLAIPVHPVTVMSEDLETCPDVCP